MLMIGKKYWIVLLLLFATMSEGCGERKIKPDTIKLELEILDSRYSFIENKRVENVNFKITIKNDSERIPFFIYTGGDAFDISLEHNGEEKGVICPILPSSDKADYTSFVPLKPGESYCTLGSVGLFHGINKITIIYKVPESFSKWGQNIWIGKIMSNTVDVKMKHFLFSREVSYIIKASIIALLFIIMSIITYRLIRKKVSATEPA